MTSLFIKSAREFLPQTRCWCATAIPLLGPFRRAGYTSENSNLHIEPMTHIDIYLDASGLDCPLPLLKAKQALNRMAAGQVLEVLATDVGSWRDFEVFAKQSGHTLLLSEEQDASYRYLFRKK